jgi:hypothetical protein
MPVSMYQHECEPLGLMLITGIMMQHKVLCFLWEVGFEGVLVIPVSWGGGMGACLLLSFLLCKTR